LFNSFFLFLCAHELGQSKKKCHKKRREDKRREDKRREEKIKEEKSLPIPSKLKEKVQRLLLAYRRISLMTYPQPHTS
jgi:hypothetical protein